MIVRGGSQAALDIIRSCLSRQLTRQKNLLQITFFTFNMKYVLRDSSRIEFIVSLKLVQTRKQVLLKDLRDQSKTLKL